MIFASSLAIAADALLHAKAGALIAALAGLVMAAALRSMLQVAAATNGQQAAQRAKQAARSCVYPALLTASPGSHAMLGEAVADAIDRVEDLEGYHARFLPLRLAAVVTPLLIALAALAGSWVAAGIMLATLVPFAFGMALAGSVAARAAQRQLEALGRLSGLFVDRVRALPVIAGFGAGERVGRHLEDACRDVAQRTLSVLRAAFISGAVLEFFAALSVALVAVYCGFSLLGLLPFPAPEELTLGKALFVLALAPEFYLPMRRLAAAYHDKQVGQAALERLAAYRPARGGAASATPYAPPSLRFDDVVVAYGEALIGPVSFTAKAGTITALRGVTGAGKSSMLHAMLGLAPIGSGRIILNDTDVGFDGLRGQIGWAGQTVALLPGTLADNIRLARPDADDAAVEDAAMRAGLGPLVQARGQGMALPLDHRGSGLSGGERRRIAIARVLLRDAPLWLLDEPTADLDEASASAIIRILQKAAQGRTVIVATHNEALAAIADAQIVITR